MKAHAKFIFVILAMAVYSAVRAFAGDLQLQATDNHHGGYIYLYRQAQTTTTMAFGGHAKEASRTRASAKPTNPSRTGVKYGLREFTTPHGTVNYIAPIE